MLFDVRYSCAGFPDGSIEHGRLKIKARGCDEDLARDMIAHLLQHPHYTHPDDSPDTTVFVLDDEEEEADDPCLEVLEGEGDALSFNPLGERRYDPKTLAWLKQQGIA